VLSENNLKLRFVRNTRAVITFDLGFSANFLLVNHMCVNTYTSTLLSYFIVLCQILIRKAEFFWRSAGTLWKLFLVIFSTQNSINMPIFTTNKHTC